MEAEWPGSFAIITGSERAFLYLCPNSDNFLFYAGNVIESLVQKLGMKEVSIPSDSFFIGHGCLQYDSAEWCRNNFLRYQMYLIPENVRLKDTINFPCRSNLRASTKNDKENADEDSTAVLSNNEKSKS